MDPSLSSSPLRLSATPAGPGATLTTPKPTLVAAAGPGRQPTTTTCLRAISPSPSPSPPTPVESFGFDALKETFSVDVAAADARPLDVPLAAPFTIASSRLVAVSNVAVRVELRSGAVGWGEAPVLPSVTAEDQPAALDAAGRACAALEDASAAPLGALLQDVASVLPGHAFASVRNPKLLSSDSTHRVKFAFRCRRGFTSVCLIIDRREDRNVIRVEKSRLFGNLNLSNVLYPVLCLEMM